MADVPRIFAAAGPFGRNAQLRRRRSPTRLRRAAGLPSSRRQCRDFVRIPLAAAGAGRRPLADGVDQCAPRRAVDDRIGRQVELQQAHRALDIDADRPGIDVRRRDHHAADRRAVAAVGIGIEHQSVTPGASRELIACCRHSSSNVLRIASVPMTVIGFVLAAGRQDRGRFAGGNELVGHVRAMSDDF